MNDHTERLYERQRYAGSFEFHLIEAYLRADPSNKATLEDAFAGTQFDLVN
tara:strand:- start:510 stop:662 length:153 start_codon:yes stop_codon:yes gene_type:complete